MGGLRRFVLFVFSVAGILCLAALALPWFGLFPDELGALAGYEAYWVAVEVCLAMTAAWLVFNLGRALFSHRRREAISVMDIDGGTITVARGAVASQAGHIVEALGLGVAKGVEVRAGKTGPVRVEVKVTPYESIDVTSEAPVLHDALVTGLSAMCGERLGAVDVEFLEPQRGTSLVVAADDAEGGYDGPDDGYDGGYEDGEASGADAGDLRAADAGRGAKVPGGDVAPSPEGAADAEGADGAAAPGPDGISIPLRAERGE